MSFRSIRKKSPPKNRKRTSTWVIPEIFVAFTQFARWLWIFPCLYPHNIRHKKQPLETGKITLLILKRFVSQCYSEFLEIACYPCVWSFHLWTSVPTTAWILVEARPTTSLELWAWLPHKFPGHSQEILTTSCRIGGSQMTERLLSIPRRNNSL